MVLIIRILLFRVLYSRVPYFRKLPYGQTAHAERNVRDDLSKRLKTLPFSGPELGLNLKPLNP